MEDDLRDDDHADAGIGPVCAVEGLVDVVEASEIGRDNAEVS